MAYLTRDEILSAHDLATETVAVPEWGGEVLVRGLSGRERDGFEASVLEMRGQDTKVNLINLRAKLVAHCVIDAETGRRLFGDADIAALGDKSALALQRVFDVAQRLSGLSRSDVEELAKKSDDGQSVDSGFGSLLLSVPQ